MAKENILISCIDFAKTVQNMAGNFWWVKFCDTENTTILQVKKTLTERVKFIPYIIRLNTYLRKGYHTPTR